MLPWTAQGPDVPAPVPFGNPQRGTTDAEEERGLDLPIHVFPLFENALRAYVEIRNAIFKALGKNTGPEP